MRFPLVGQAFDEDRCEEGVSTAFVCALYFLSENSLLLDVDD